MAVKPEDLDEDTSPNDNDIVMKTNSNHATRTIKFSNIWSWIWTKVYNKIISSEVTLHAIDEAKPYQPVDSTAVINSAISALDTSNPAPVNSTAVNGALTKLLKVKDFYWYGSVSGSGAYYKNILSDIYTYCGATNIISVIEYYWSSIPVNHSLCLNDKALTLIYEKGYENQNVQIKCKIYYN